MKKPTSRCRRGRNCGSSFPWPDLRLARAPGNRGRIIEQKRPLLPKHVWSIRVRREMAVNWRDLALFNMAVTSQTPGLRSCLPQGERRLRRRPGQGTYFGHADQNAQDQLHESRDQGLAADACEHSQADPNQDRGLCARPQLAGEQCEIPERPRGDQASGRDCRVIMDDQGNVQAVLTIGPRRLESCGIWPAQLSARTCNRFPSCRSTGLAL